MPDEPIVEETPVAEDPTTAEPAAEPEASPAAAAPAAPKRPPTDSEKRIAGLTGKWRAEENARKSIEAQLAQVTRQRDEYMERTRRIESQLPVATNMAIEDRKKRFEAELKTAQQEYAQAALNGDSNKMAELVGRIGGVSAQIQTLPTPAEVPPAPAPPAPAAIPPIYSEPNFQLSFHQWQSANPWFSVDQSGKPQNKLSQIALQGEANAVQSGAKLGSYEYWRIIDNTVRAAQYPANGLPNPAVSGQTPATAQNSQARPAIVAASAPRSTAPLAGPNRDSARLTAEEREVFRRMDLNPDNAEHVAEYKKHQKQQDNAKR